MPLQRLYTGPAGYTMNDYQEDALRTAAENPDREEIAGLTLGLAGESGEVADHVKKWLIQGHHLDPVKIKDELGDVLWYIAVLARALSIPLGDIAAYNTEKLKARYPEGFSTERSLNR